MGKTKTVFKVDWGTYEKGVVIDVPRARSVDQALSMAKNIAVKKGHSGDAVQVIKVTGSDRRIVWDFMNGGLE